MSAERLDDDYVRDIYDALQSVAEFVGDMDFDSFCADAKTNFAVVRALEIIGEAAKRLSPALTDKHTEISWRSVAGMRDKLIHGYFGVDLEVVWRTVQDDLPELRGAGRSVVQKSSGARSWPGECSRPTRGRREWR